MNRLIRGSGAVALLAISGLALWGAVLAFQESEQRRQAYYAWHEEWDEQEAQCLDDPSCDLGRFDRRRELAKTPGDGFGTFFVAVLLGVVHLGLLLGGGVVGYSTFSPGGLA